jgi:hypothetical protein
MLRSLHNWNTIHATKMNICLTESILRRDFLLTQDTQPFPGTRPATMMRLLNLMDFLRQFLACLQQISYNVSSVQFPLFFLLIFQVLFLRRSFYKGKMKESETSVELSFSSSPWCISEGRYFRHADFISVAGGRSDES